MPDLNQGLEYGDGFNNPMEGRDIGKDGFDFLRRGAEAAISISVPIAITKAVFEGLRSKFIDKRKK